MFSSHLASYIAAQCVRHFCRNSDLSDKRIEEFCVHLENASIVTDLPNWDAVGNRLAISGLGDPLPNSLASVSGLSSLIENAREVSASQLYAAWAPEQVSTFLSKCIEISGFDFNSEISSAALTHQPDTSGWGDAVTIAVRNTWRTHV